MENKWKNYFDIQTKFYCWKELSSKFQEVGWVEILLKFRIF